MSNEGGYFEVFKKWIVKNIFILLNDFLLHPSLPKMKTNSQKRRKKMKIDIFMIFFQERYFHDLNVENRPKV